MKPKLLPWIFALTASVSPLALSQEAPEALAPEALAPEALAPEALAPATGVEDPKETVSSSAVPHSLPVSQENRGVKVTLQSLEFEKSINDGKRHVIFFVNVSSEAPDAQPAPKRTLESYLRSPLQILADKSTIPGRNGRYEGRYVIEFRELPNSQTRLKFRVSFLDPRVKIAVKDLNRVSALKFARVPIPRVLNEPVAINSSITGEHGAIVTLKSATLRVAQRPDTPRDEKKREVVLNFSLQQPAPKAAQKNTANLEYIDKEWNSIVSARDDKGIEWTRRKVTFGSPNDLSQSGDYSFAFPEADSPQAATFDFECGLREVVKHSLPASNFRRFLFDVDLGKAG